MKKSKYSFTLIETIVVIAIIALTLPVIFAIIFTLMREQIKVYRQTEVKRNGDYLINNIENTIRDNAAMVLSAKPPGGTEICNAAGSPSSGSSIYFLDKDGQWFSYSSVGNVVSSSSAYLESNGGSLPLISNKTFVNSFSVGCSNSSVFSAPKITMSFDICYASSGSIDCSSLSARPEENATMHYQTIINLRNY